MPVQTLDAGGPSPAETRKVVCPAPPPRLFPTSPERVMTFVGVTRFVTRVGQLHSRLVLLLVPLWHLGLLHFGRRSRRDFRGHFTRPTRHRLAGCGLPSVLRCRTAGRSLGG